MPRTEHAPGNANRTIDMVFTETLAKGGLTLHAATLTDFAGPLNVWAVGRSLGIETQSVNIDFLDGLNTENAARDAFANAIDRIREGSTRIIGTWVHEDNIYIDAVDLFAHTDEAIDAGYTRGEKAIYHLSTHRTLELS